MTTARKAFLALLLLDLGSVLMVFNTVSFFRGLSADGRFVVTPLIGPLAAVVFAIYLIDGYRIRTDMLSLDYASQHGIALVAAMLATLLTTYAILPSGYELQSSRIVIALSYVILIPLTLSYRRLIYQRAATMRGTRALVFVGDDRSCDAFRADCERVHTSQPVIYTVADPVNRDDAVAPRVTDDRPVRRQFNDVLMDIQAGRLEVEAIILRESTRDLDPAISLRLVELYFTGVPTYTLELFHQVYWRKIPLYRLDQNWLFQEGFQIAREPVFERLKRAADVVFALIGLLATAPIIAVGAVAVWLDDGGDAFFKQNRVGKNHTTFALYKLRTMHCTDEQPTDLYTRVGDARITRVGRFLRATRIDELPQLWNVLCGHMSLIGPRAEWDRLVENYEREIPCYHFRHLVKPGITGWAQVNYPYGGSIDDTLRKLEYDLYYIRHFSFLLDASIVLKTIHLMLFGKGR